MGRPEEPLPRDGSPEREFAFWLRDLRNSAGLTYQQLARAATYSTSTMQAAAAGRQLPTLKVVMAFVRACGGDQAQWQAYWTQVKRALDSDSPYDRKQTVRPPWAGEPETTAPEAIPNSAPESAQNASSSAAADGENGWYVESFTALLRLDTAQPEAIEDRVIVATVDGLRELTTSISVPRHPDDSSPAHQLNAELLYGGSLQQSDQPYESYFRNIIALAQPLMLGERHKYRLRLRVPPGQPMAPHYVYMPFHRTDHYELRVRFDPQHLPKKIWRICGTPPVVLYEDHPEGAALTPDRFGEIRVEFDDLRLGLGYGIHWQE